MREEACLVTIGTASAEDEKLGRLLEFFGIDFVWIAPNELNSALLGNATRVLCSAAAFAAIERELRPERIHSVFVYENADAAAQPGRTEWTIADDPIAGAMAGLRVTSCGSVALAETAAENGQPIIFSGDHAAFVRSESNGIPTYFALSAEFIDLEAELTTPNFDIRDHFLSAAPVVMYLRWAFPKSAWHPAETGACLIIDDPLLRPRYGFIRFRKLLVLMEEHDFSTCVAFIPWNWQRNDPETLRLFKANPQRLSIAVHGCDHTAAEFGTEDPAHLRQLVSTARTRMSAHARETGLPHDPVMVFPQGVFSAAAVGELERGGFSAIVNTEVKAVGNAPARLTIADVWDVAVMRYDKFPIFTRRYPRQGVENLAFDILLGKPCLIVIHHDFCSDGYGRLIDFIKQVNALKADLVWRGLGDVVARSYRQRENAAGEMEVQRYAREATPAAEVEQARNGQSPAPGVKTRLRRYLSEARDNYVMPAKARLSQLSRS